MDPVLLVFACALGLAVGSFLNVVIYRVPRGLSVGGRSHCPKCDYQLSPFDNIPVVSWIVLRGRCRKCRTGISAQYPVIEAATAAGYVIAVQRFGVAWLTIAVLVFYSVTLALFVIDLQTMRLPDRLTLPLFAVMVGGLGAVSLVEGELSALVRALAGAAVLSLAYATLWTLTAGRGLGLGDVKLALSLGLVSAYLSWETLAVSTALAWILGALVGVALILAGYVQRKRPIPFGPFLIAGCWVGLLFGNALFSQYWAFMTSF